MVTRAGARTGRQLQGRGDTQGFNSPSVARLYRSVQISSKITRVQVFRYYAPTLSILANDTPKTPLPGWDSSIRPRPTEIRLCSEMVVPNLKTNEKKRLRSEMVVPNLKNK